MRPKEWMARIHRVRANSFAKCLRAAALFVIGLSGIVRSGYASEAPAWNCEPPPKTAASWVYEQGFPGQLPVRTTTRYKNGFERFDLGAPGETSPDALSSSTLFMANGDVIMLLHGQRSYTRQTASDIKQGQEARRSMGRPARQPQISEVVDGKQEKSIDGRKAHLYVIKFTDGAWEGEAWTSTDFADLDAVRRAMYCAAKQADSVGSGLGPALIYQVPGVALDIRIRMNSVETSARFVSHSFDPIPDNVFVIPAGYKEMAAPFSGGVPAPAAPPPK